MYDCLQSAVYELVQIGHRVCALLARLCRTSTQLVKQKWRCKSKQDDLLQVFDLKIIKTDFILSAVFMCGSQKRTNCE